VFFMFSTPLQDDVFRSEALSSASTQLSLVGAS
jgi:hypothetical protein